MENKNKIELDLGMVAKLQTDSFLTTEQVQLFFNVMMYKYFFKELDIKLPFSYKIASKVTNLNEKTTINLLQDMTEREILISENTEDEAITYEINNQFDFWVPIQKYQC